MRKFLIKTSIIVLISIALVTISRESAISCPNVEIFTASTTNPLVYEPVNITVRVVPQEKQRIKRWNISTDEGEWGQVTTVDFADVGAHTISITVEWEYQNKDGKWKYGDSDLVTGTKSIDVQVYADIGIYSGNNQKVRKNGVADSLVVYVCDYYGDSMGAGMSVSFTGPVTSTSVTTDEFGYASTELRTDTANKYEISATGDDILNTVTFDEIVYGVTITNVSPRYLAKGSGISAIVTYTILPEDYTPESVSMTAGDTTWILTEITSGGTHTVDLIEGTDLINVGEYEVKIQVDGADSNIKKIYIVKIQMEMIDARIAEGVKVYYRTSQKIDSAKFESPSVTGYYLNIDVGSFYCLYGQGDLIEGDNTLTLTATLGEDDLIVQNNVNRTTKYLNVSSAVAFFVVIEHGGVGAVVPVAIGHNLHEKYYDVTYPVQVVTGSKTTWVGYSSTDIATTDYNLSQLYWAEQHYYSNNTGNFLTVDMSPISTPTLPPQSLSFISKECSKDQFYPPNEGLRGTSHMVGIGIFDKETGALLLPLPLPPWNGIINSNVTVTIK